MKPISSIFFIDLLITLFAILITSYLIYKIITDEIGMPEKENAKKTVTLSVLILVMINFALTYFAKFPLLMGGIGYILVWIIVYYSLLEKLDNSLFSIEFKNLKLKEYINLRNNIKWIIIVNLLLLYYSVTYNALSINEVHIKPTSIGYTIDDKILQEAESGMRFFPVLVAMLLSTFFTIFLVPQIRSNYPNYNKRNIQSSLNNPEH